MRRLYSLLFAALVLAPTAVRAADVPVVYTVDTTALKLAISGTNLTFELHTNATCTALAHTQILTIDATNMQSVLKRSKPKNGVKPPKTTDIRATLTGVAPAAPLYLTVSGTGITAVGGGCQVQASTAAGPGGVSPVLRDANGALIGPIESSGQYIMSVSGTLVVGSAFPTGFSTINGFYYVSNNCTGPRLSQPSPALGGFGQQALGVDGTTLYYGPATTSSVAWASFDFAPQILANCNSPFVFVPPDRCCCPSPTCTGGGTFDLGPPSTVNIGGFVTPFSVSLE